MTSTAEWKRWLRRWDAQQESFHLDREARFGAMLDVLQAQLGRRFRALDLGCGPGSLSARLLRRFPSASVVAVDHDPVVLRVGQGALGSAGGRLRWVDTKMGSAGWHRALPPGRFDAAVSTTALHWLRPRPLRTLYGDLARLVRPGGVVLNGDMLAWGPEHREFAEIARKVRALHNGRKSSKAAWSPWEKWWSDAERVPELRPLFVERARRHSQHPDIAEPSLAVHVSALRSAGFRDVQTVWQVFQNRVLCAVR